MKKLKEKDAVGHIPSERLSGGRESGLPPRKPGPDSSVCGTPPSCFHPGNTVTPAAAAKAADGPCLLATL